MKKKLMYPPRILYGLMALLLWCSNAGAQGLFIGDGVQVVTASSPNIVLSNLEWMNNGVFVPSYSRVKLHYSDMSKKNYYLRGDSATTFYHLLVSAANGILFIVEQDANVIARMDFSGTMTSFGDADITLLPGAVIGNDPDGLLTGNNARIMTTVMLNRPQAFNPGNLGLEITSNEDLGLTTIIRGFREQINSAGEKSIERYYDILPSNQPTRPVSLRFRYHEAELNGNSKSRLAVFSGKPGSRLSMLAGSGSDGINWVSAGNVPVLQRFTLANAIAGHPAPAGKLSVKAYPNPFRDRFTVTVHSDAGGPVEMKMINLSGVIVERRIVQLQPGNNYIAWSAAGYTPGNYQLVIGGDIGKAIKIMKQ